MKKPITDWNKFRDQFVRWTLRRASFRWPPRGEAMKQARVERGLYQCALCPGRFKTKEVKLDHINPVVPIVREAVSTGGGSLDLGSYVHRMFPEASGFQVLCEGCHLDKTARECEARAQIRRERKFTAGTGSGQSGSERRRRKAKVGSPTVEGGKGTRSRSDLRRRQVLSQRVENCTKCQRSVFSSSSEAPLCDQCRGEG